jgi:peptide/nickel transport system ATP-binding protein
MTELLMTVENLVKWFPVRRSFLSARQYLKAIDGVSFEIHTSEILGLAGESGSGKTTCGKLVIRLLEPTGGKVLFNGEDIMRYDSKRLLKFREDAQIVFQDPYDSMNPRQTVFQILQEPLDIHGLAHSREESTNLIYKALEDVQLAPPEEFTSRFPHELSGGQRQRVAVARSLILNPKFIVADEPVSMLDMSVRAEILNLFLDLIKKYHLSLLFITHDLAVSKYITDRLAIMYLGKIVEIGKPEEVVDTPFHPYTEALVAAIPVPDPRVKIGEIPIKGEIPSPINPPSGCGFHPRCPIAVFPICKDVEPPLEEKKPGHLASCHFSYLLIEKHEGKELSPRKSLSR